MTACRIRRPFRTGAQPLQGHGLRAELTDFANKVERQLRLGVQVGVPAVSQQAVCQTMIGYPPERFFHGYHPGLQACLPGQHYRIARGEPAYAARQVYGRIEGRSEEHTSELQSL